MEDFEVKAIRVWMRSIMDVKDWTPNKWATLSGTSPTNITRFLNGSKFVPSSKTIAKLAAVAGSSPDLGGQSLTNFSSQSVQYFCAISCERIGEMTVHDVKGDLVAYKFDRELTPYGLAQGDTLVVRKQTKFETGDTVVHRWLDNGLTSCTCQACQKEADNREELGKDGRMNLKHGLGLGIKIKGHNEIWKARRKAAVSLNDVEIIGKLVQIIKNLE